MDGRIANMENVEMNCNRGSALLFFLTGLGAGIGVTVLLAPRSGAATRRLIGRKVEEGQDWMKDKAAAAQDYVRGHGEELRDRVKEVAEVVGEN
jgi:gas vesicle protein